MDRYDEMDEQQERWEQAHDYCILWECPECGWTYEDRPGWNEACPCPKCQTPTIQIGESYE